MEYPGCLRLVTKLFSRKRDSFPIYVYTVACILLIIGLQFWAYEKKPEWFSLKWEWTANGNYTAFQHFENADVKDRAVNSESQTLEHDIAAMCLLKNFDMDTKVELTAAEGHCLVKALLDKLSKKQASLSINTLNTTISNSFINLLASALNRNGKSDSEVSQHEIKELKFKLKTMEDKIRESVTFLPLKDTRFTGFSDQGHTWFMSTLRGKKENGNSEHFYFPSEISNGRILCVQGRHPNDGSQNSYGFAWQQQLPPNSILLPGLTFVSDNYFDYVNPWHSLTALAGFVNWHKENECTVPERFVLYHWGEVVKTMGSWISHIMHASLGRSVEVDSLEYGDGPVCFEKAIVYRDGLGPISSEKRTMLFDMIRCKAWKLCNVSAQKHFINGIRVVNLTLLARTGSRSFKNESTVASVLEKECRKVDGCNFRLVHIKNLSFCDQVSVMSSTDILATVHGAQLADMIFMEKESSVMEMFPKGWLEFAGNGQNVFQWLASWSGMKHEGTWHDNEGPACPNPEKGILHCFNFHKDVQVGHNETNLAGWTADVLQKFQNRTTHLATDSSGKDFVPLKCPCDHVNDV